MDIHNRVAGLQHIVGSPRITGFLTIRSYRDLVLFSLSSDRRLRGEKSSCWIRSVTMLKGFLP